MTSHPQAPNSGWRSPWLWAALALLALLRMWSLDLPLDRDEGEYATLAQQWLHGTGVPYRDFLEQKPPLAVWLDMLAFALIGESAASVRWASQARQLATGAALFALLRTALARLEPPVANADAWAALGVAIYAFAANGARAQGLLANTETLIALPMLVALRLLLPERSGAARGNLQWALAGVCIGVAGLAKQVALPAALLLPLGCARSPGDALRTGAAMALGVSLPWLASWALFAAQGAGGDFWFCLFAYNFSYSAGSSGLLLSRLQSALLWVGPELSIAVFAMGLGLWRWRAIGSPLARLLFAWLAASWLGVFLSGWVFAHYFLLPIAAMVSVGIAGIAARPPERRGALLIALLSLLCLAGWSFENAPVWRAEGGLDRIRQIHGAESFAQSPAVAERIRSLAREPEAKQGGLWMYGSEPQLFFLSGMRPATRFLFHYPFTGVAPPWPGGVQELVDALRDPRVRLAIKAKGLDPKIPFQAYLAQLLERDFELVESYPGRIHLYRRVRP